MEGPRTAWANRIAVNFEWCIFDSNRPCNLQHGSLAATVRYYPDTVSCFIS